ncbi:MAG: hypothetical protein K2J73_08690 [Oscillospiraceae bacterium]|nr:hypothetical protein [Oscillospiraceae bacterium]
MEHLYKLKDALMDSLEELDTIKNGRLKMSELEAINYITDTIKNIDKICMLEEDDGYSGAGNWEARIDGTYGNSRMNDRNRHYDSESSYANRGKHWVKGHYSRADAKEMTMKHLEKAMDSATDHKEREAIEKAMETIERM